MKRSVLIPLLATALAVAAADSATMDRYGGSLPCTGLDLVLVAGAGAVLLLLGVWLRRNASPREVSVARTERSG